MTAETSPDTATRQQLETGALPVRSRLAVAAERLASGASRRLGRGSGEMIGGKLALRVDPQIATVLKDQVLPRLLTGVREVRQARPDALEQSLVLQRRYLDAMRDALGAERSIGAYSSETYKQVERLLDSFEQRVGR